MESSWVSIENTDSSCFQGVSKAINLKITDYAYGVLDPKRKPASNSSESVESAYEVTENLPVGYTNSIDDAVSEYFSVANSLIPPPETFESSSSFFSMESWSSISESDECDNSATSGSFSVPSESDNELNDTPDILKSVKRRIDKLSKSLDDLQDSPKQTFVPLAAQSTPIKSTDISYPQTLAFRPLKQKTTSGRQTKILNDIAFEKYDISYNKLKDKLRKLKLSEEEQRYSQVISELEEKFKLEKANRDKMNGSTDSGLDSETNKTAEKDKGFYKQFAAEINTNVAVTQVHTCAVEHQGTSSNNQLNTEIHTGLSEDSSEYDEGTFLFNAIGEEILNTEAAYNFVYPLTASINTAEISELMSSQSIINNIDKLTIKARRSINSIMTHSYESSPNIENSQDIRSTSGLVNEPFRYGYTDGGNKQIKKHIYINEHIIGQTEKMLKYGVKTPRFIGSLAHLEAERILLLSKTRRQVLINHLYKIPEAINKGAARVTIEKLKCILNRIQETSSKRQFFVCILKHKTTVYSTKIAAANNQGLVEFGGFFIFENVSNTFNIKIQLYSVTLPKSSKGCMVLPFVRGNHKAPLMEFVGELPIGILNIKNKKFTFKNLKNNKSSEHKLLASIEATVVWPEPLRGFVTVGTGKIDEYPTWNKRWCVMEDATLRFYNYPSEERFRSPLSIVDLKLCKRVDDDTVKYMGQKTMRLFMEKENNLRRLFISPDDYDLWSNHLDIVLELNNQWKSLRN